MHFYTLGNNFKWVFFDFNCVFMQIRCLSGALTNVKYKFLIFLSSDTLYVCHITNSILCWPRFAFRLALQLFFMTLYIYSHSSSLWIPSFYRTGALPATESINYINTEQKFDYAEIRYKNWELHSTHSIIVHYESRQIIKYGINYHICMILTIFLMIN